MKISIIRKIILKYHLGVFMIMSILFFSCSKDKFAVTSSTISSSSAATIQAISDDDVLKGVMFLENPIADRLPEIKDFSTMAAMNEPSKVAAKIKFENAIISKLKAIDGNYLINFRANVGSGDYYTVKTAIEKAANDIINIAAELTGKNRTDLINSANTLANNFMSKHNLKANSSVPDVRAAVKGQINNGGGL